MSTKKHPLKFFTLILEEYNEDGLLDATKVPAKKGKTLLDLVEPILENYGMSLERHSLFLGSSSTPLHLNEDTHQYRGLTLYVRENEKSRIISFRKNDSRKSMTGVTKRFSQLLEEHEVISFETDKTDGLKEDQGRDEFALEDSWKDVIPEEEDMANREKVQQEAMWELFTTEVNYIKDLKVIIEVFKRCFKMLQYGGYLTEVNEALIFANIEDIYNVNVTFWGKLKNIIENARVTKQPISPSDLVESFDGFEDLFQPYIKFCNTDVSKMKLPDYPSSTNEMIKQFIAWCDNHERCKRITVAGFLIKPLQRVTKYTLLLKAILNKTDNETEKCIAEKIMSRVETFVSKINSTVHLRQEQEKLTNVISRLSDYCPVEPVNDEVEKIIKEYCTLNLKGSIPGLPEDENRFILKEGPMKLVEKQGKKEVYAFLFSDIFVVTKLKRNTDKFRINRQPYRLNKVLLRDLKDPGQLLFVYLNEYGVIATAFVLQVNIHEQEKWRIALEKAKANYDLIRREFGLRNEFWDDDFPTSSVNKYKNFRQRTFSIRKNSLLPIILPDLPPEFNPPESNPPEKLQSTYGWDGALTFAVMIIFILLNVSISLLIG